MKVKRLIAFLLAIVCVIGLAACGKDVEKEPVDDSSTVENTEPTYMTMRGTVLEIYDNSVLVQPLPDDPANASADKIDVALKGTITWEDKKVGDVIEVAYQGGIQETYPARISNVVYITLMGNSADEIPDVPQPEPNEPTEKPVDFDFDMTFTFEPCELYNDDCTVFEALDLYFDEERGLVFKAKVFEVNNDRAHKAGFIMTINGHDIETIHSADIGDDIIEWTVGLSELANLNIKNVETVTLTNVEVIPVADDAVVAFFDAELQIYNDGLPVVETVIFNNTEYNKKDLSKETLQWIEWYNSLPGEEQIKVDSYPSELTE